MAVLEKDFIASFSKMGVKHKPESKIQGFKQKEHETVRDCVNRLKQYIARCPIEEKPSQTKLVSIFLEGLKDKTLYKHLYAMKHQSFIECCKDAMDLDDNFDDDDDTTSESTRTGVHLPRRMTQAETTSSTGITTDQIVDTVLQRLGQTYRPPMRQNWNPTQTSNMPGPSPQVQRKWCQVCKWNLTHETQDCIHIARLARERETGIVAYAKARQSYSQPVEQAREHNHLLQAQFL